MSDGKVKVFGARGVGAPGKKRPPRPLDKVCGARTAKGICENWKGFKTNHPGFGACNRHGGMTPSGIKSAMKEMATKAVETYGLPRRIGPHEALLEEVWRTAGHVQWLGQRVSEQEQRSLIWGTVEASTKGIALVGSDGEEGEPADPLQRAVERSVKEGASINMWLKLYNDERAHLVDVCKTAIACGIAERQVRIAEEHGRIIAAVIAGVLEDVGVDASDDAVRNSMRSRLLLAAGEEAD